MNRTLSRRIAIAPIFSVGLCATYLATGGTQPAVPRIKAIETEEGQQNRIRRRVQPYATVSRRGVRTQHEIGQAGPLPSSVKHLRGTACHILFQATL
jgi:hypothetical protein